MAHTTTFKPETVARYILPAGDVTTSFIAINDLPDGTIKTTMMQRSQMMLVSLEVLAFGAPVMTACIEMGC